MNKLNIRPLSVNEGYTGRRFKTEAHRAWHKSVLFMLPKTFVLPPAPYELHLKFGFTTKASDCTNPIKFLEDCLAEKYKFNDNLVYRVIVEKEVVGKGKEYIQWNILHFEK